MATHIPGTEIYLGDARDASREGQLYAAILNVAEEVAIRPAPGNYHKIGLTDGMNPPTLFYSAVLAFDGLLRAYDKVLIHCSAGISRSPTVLATWLTWRKRATSLDDALNMLASHRSCVDPCSDLIVLGQNFLYSVGPYVG